MRTKHETLAFLMARLGIQFKVNYVSRGGTITKKGIEAIIDALGL